MNNPPPTNQLSVDPPVTKMSLADAINHVDDFLEQINSSTLPSTVKELSSISTEVHDTTFSRAQLLNQAMVDYVALVRQDKETAIQAEAHGRTAFDVERARDDVQNAKKRALEYKSYRDNEQRDVDTLQHQINAIKAGIAGEESWGDDEEMEKLQQDLSSLEAKLHIYQQLSHVTFAENNSIGGKGAGANIIQGFATFNVLGDIRPFEIDLDATPATEIHDMIWGWLYDEHCSHKG